MPASPPRAARPPGRPAGAGRTGTSAGRAGRARARRPRTACPRRRGEDLAEEPGQQPVHHEGRRVLDQHAVLLQRLADGERGGQPSRRRSAAPRTTSTSGIIATGLKKWKPDHPLGMRQPGRHLGHRQRGGVRGQHAVRPDDRLDLGEHPLLDRQLLEHRLDHEVGVGERVLGQRPGDQRGQPARRVGADPAAGAAACRSRPARGRARRPAGPGPGRSAPRAPRSRRANSSAICAAISPAPTTPTLVTGRASDASGAPAGAPGPLLHQVERVEPGAQLLAEQQVGERLVLGGEPLVAGRGRGPRPPGRGPGTAPGRRRAACRRRTAAPRPRGWSQLAAVASRAGIARDTSAAPVSTRAAQRSDSARKSAARTSRRRCRARRPARRAASGSG